MAAVAAEPTEFRRFSDTPREEGELAVGASWLGERFAGAVRVEVVGGDPADGKTVRLDGSYVGVTVGNFMISAGAMDRWWGPGWDGSLILSSNARPIPGLTVERNYTDASRWPVLRWFGPWRASLALGQEEGQLGRRRRHAFPRRPPQLQAALLARVRTLAHRPMVRRRPPLRLRAPSPTCWSARTTAATR